MKLLTITLLLAASAFGQISQIPGGSGGGGGTGTVTSVATGCGLSGGTITTSGTIISSKVANAQTGTTYTVLTGDCGKVVTFSNAGAIAVTLPQAGVSFPDGWYFYAKNIGVGDVTITPTTSTISGAASIVISTGEWALITSDGTNYGAEQVRNVAGTGVVLTKARTGVTTAVDTATILTRATDQAGTDKYVRSTSGNDTYVGSVTPALTAYTTGGCFVLNGDTANTGTATININSLGAKSILNRAGGALADGDITANVPISICYDGTSFIIQGDGGGSASGTVTSVGWTGGIVSVGTPTTTPAFTIAGTSGGLPYFSSASTWASSGAGTAGALINWGGAGTAPGEIDNSTEPNAGELRIATTANASATRCVFCIGPTAWASGNANGTYIGANAGAGFTGHLMRLATNSTTMFSLDGAGDARAISFQAVNSGFGLLAGGLSFLNNGAIGIVNNSTGSSAVMRITGNGGTANTNFLAIRGTSGGTPTDQIRINADQKAVMIGQTANTTSLSGIDLYIGNRTASAATGVVLEEGPTQSTTDGFAYKLYNATANTGTKVWSIAAGGIPQWGSTTEATCNSGTRGQLVMVQGGAGVADTFRVCRKDAADAYAWTALY